MVCVSVTSSAVALLLYEHIITLGQESRFVWTDICAGHAVIFIVNRLNMVSMSVDIILSLHTWRTIMLQGGSNTGAVHLRERVSLVGRCFRAPRLRYRQSRCTACCAHRSACFGPCRSQHCKPSSSTSDPNSA
ncbi:hypothetical protein DAEQUDRAFT_330245 [Daedalea quercina L-15889]|uniref:DUF6533 domain-containing protein n=1 Tax=Daedalea quercina L-15889 TaxID=1314783 RepID=A0A165PQX2_9APHY|nr:hypothetical protein DAEQUDRAFT_330245 [Daedalea quercina L-15889]